MAEESKKKLGRPRKIIDTDKLSGLIGKGFTVEFAADFFGVHVDTLYANYSDALRKGRVFREGCLQAKQFKGAMKGDTTLQIWLGKQWLGQSDKREITGAGGGPITVQVVFDTAPQRQLPSAESH
jgi:hypothetical protein